MSLWHGVLAGLSLPWLVFCLCLQCPWASVSSPPFFFCPLAVGDVLLSEGWRLVGLGSWVPFWVPSPVWLSLRSVRFFGSLGSVGFSSCWCEFPWVLRSSGLHSPVWSCVVPWLVGSKTGGSSCSVLMSFGSLLGLPSAFGSAQSYACPLVLWVLLSLLGVSVSPCIWPLGRGALVGGSPSRL